MTCGVYALTNQTSGKQYVGSAVNIERRIKKHMWMLATNQHPSARLSQACAKHGVGVFICEVLEECSETMLIEREQFWIDKLKPRYNRRLVPAHNAGLRMTPAERAAHSEAMRAACDNPETRARLTATIKASWADPEQRAQRIASLKAAWTPKKRAAWSKRMQASGNIQSVIGVRWTLPGAKERASEALRASHARRGAPNTVEAIRALVEATAGWSVVFIEGPRVKDRVVVRCDAHGCDTEYSVREVLYRSRGCKLCGYERTATKQRGDLHYSKRGS